MDSPAFARSVHGRDNEQDSDDDAEIYKYRARLESTGIGANQSKSEPNSAHVAVENGETETSTPSEETIQEEQRRNPFYSYATEKYDSHADAKLIYQRHRLDTRSGEGESPLLLAKSATLPASFFDGDLAGLSRSASINSRSSNRAYARDPTISSHHSGLQLQTRDGQAVPDRRTFEPVTTANAKARSHANHPGLPHEYKDPLLANQDVHGAGAGMGIGSGAGGFAATEDTIVTEVETICKKIKTLLDLRRKYLKTSLQCAGDNPKDVEDWEIYPPPPEPVWTDEKERPVASASSNALSSMSDSLYAMESSNNAEQQSPASPAKKQRKAGQAIGEDFDFSECHIAEASEMTFELDEGSVYQVYDPQASEGATPIVHVPTLRDFYMDLEIIHDISSDGPAKSFAYRRLQYLEGRYNLYSLLNEYEEVAETKKVPHRDFYNVRKVDTHVHHSACMNQKHLLRFIKSKMKKCPDECVLFRDGKTLTLREVFESISLTAYDLSIDTLDMHAHTDSFHRFDKFNLKYNPIGQSRLREIFLKTDNFIKGKYLADITREVISDLESSKYQMVEWRISIYGRNLQEWDKLAAWVVDNKIISPNVRWLIQVPRLYDMYKSSKMMENFETVITNVFQPLFEVTKDPTSHPKLHIFLHRVIGFDSVDDESKVERRLYRKYPTPKEWNSKQNPPYSYWIYFLFANMTSLNAFRKRRGFNTFLLRPHCGEAGDTDHLAAALLCCHSISHGITLRKVPIFQYAFYLDQIGIAMSPLSNNALFLTYDRNPFVSYFRKGLNVSLSTDDPLQFAFTKEPLIEEYSVAAQIYKFSAVDMCELAKHSVDQSGFELSLKQRWLGKYCYLPGALGNDVAKCNVPDVRESFRHETLKAEHSFIAKYTGDYSHFQKFNPSLPEPIDAETPIEEVFGTPKRYFEQVADSIPPPQSSRILGARSISDMDGLRKPPGRSRAASRASLTIHPVGADPVLTEPRMIPGILHENERRRSRCISSSGGSEGASAETITPGLAKLAVKEQAEADQNEQAE
ncbi:putative zinc finger protein [Endocarpon pusillum]|uniref:AMP deaminase n=1 Tax=Endocarpon pusillum TaxID=364733 RepID=A0A8H7E509_9EURO|nr:putative zinc finger protein [Endocarpon pusillum]